MEKSNRFNKLITLCDLGVGGERGIVYSPDGICTAQSATQYKDAIKVLEIKNLKSGIVMQYMGSDSDGKNPDAELINVAHSILSREYKGFANWNQNGVLEITKMEKETVCHEIGRMDNSDGSLEIANRVYADDGCSPCLNAHANDTVPKVMQIVAMRSRDKENPSGYRGPSNGNMEQALEPNSEGISNTITSVQKDNLVLETSNIVIGSMQEHASIRNDGICPTLTEAMGKGGGQTPMVMVKQATKDGYIPCEVGGGMRLELPEQHNTPWKSARERSSMSDSDNGEYP